ncbi:hypothetical protein AWC38_SpisGene15931 [Stylophora pistillata]|uniref:Uncharacterized protein n=1 Tax=Stylophora pistillata TaxID=50429 RepID=A0A2B4RTK6_STYPI|nr:hypothetical protein AWC38_SpisGene15931 [Stylophora pistillata]
MGSFDGAEVCELIGLFLLNSLGEKYGKNNVGLCRDDGLVLLRNTSRPQSERTRKEIAREFKKQGLDISISTNLKICNFLDITLNLADGSHYPYRKPNNETFYINTNSKHPPTIIKHIPAAIGRRIPYISSSKELFNKTKPLYESALKQSGHGEKLTYTERKKAETHNRKSRQRKIIWFNQPYSMNVQTNIGREFLNLVSKHFPKNHRYNKIFNKSSLKSKYLSRHDAALKVLFYQLLYDEGFIDEIPPWYSPDKPKPVYESENVKAYWDVPIYADQQEVRCNRVDARIVNHMCKRVVTLEMSCPWVNNRTRKDEEKTLKYGPLRWELRQ